MNPPAITPEWKRKVAQDAIESLSAAKLARSICSQFRTRLNSSHEAFAASLRQVTVEPPPPLSLMETEHTSGFCVFIPRRISFVRNWSCDSRHDAPDKCALNHIAPMMIHHMTTSMAHLIDCISTLGKSLLISQTSLIRSLLWNYFFFLFEVG